MTEAAAAIPEEADKGVNKDCEMEVTVANEDMDKQFNKEADMGVDVTSVKTTPADAEQAPHDYKAAEEMSPVKPNPKDRLAGEFVNPPSIYCLQASHLNCKTALFGVNAATQHSNKRASTYMLHVHLIC